MTLSCSDIGCVLHHVLSSDVFCIAFYHRMCFASCSIIGSVLHGNILIVLMIKLLWSCQYKFDNRIALLGSDLTHDFSNFLCLKKTFHTNYKIAISCLFDETRCVCLVWTMFWMISYTVHTQMVYFHRGQLYVSWDYTSIRMTCCIACSWSSLFLNESVGASSICLGKKIFSSKVTSKIS